MPKHPGSDRLAHLLYCILTRFREALAFPLPQARWVAYNGSPPLKLIMVVRKAFNSGHSAAAMAKSFP